MVSRMGTGEDAPWISGGFPLLRTALTALVFRKARVKNDEGAELYVSAENGRAGSGRACESNVSISPKNSRASCDMSSRTCMTS